MLERAIPYNGWSFLRNLGDQFGANVIEHVSGARPVLSRREENHVLGVGSIFFLANRNSHVWGTGFLNEGAGSVDLDVRKIHAVRGEKSADALIRAGYALQDVPFGDPGIFASEIVGEGQQVTRPVLIVPHFLGYKFYKDYYGDSREVKVLDVATNKIDTIREIASAEIVLSESLHGLIFACSLGKRLTWIGDAERDNFKYHDWLSTTDSKNLTPLDHDRSLDRLVREARIVESRIDKEALRKAFLSHLSFFRESKGRIDYGTSRAHEYFVSVVKREDIGLQNESPLSSELLFTKARAHFRKLFANWDEPVYGLLILAGEGPLPDREQMREILFEMDHHFHLYATILSKQEAEESGLIQRECGRAITYCMEEVPAPSAILVRPHYGSESGGPVVFCV